MIIDTGYLPWKIDTVEVKRATCSFTVAFYL